MDNSVDLATAAATTAMLLVACFPIAAAVSSSSSNFQHEVSKPVHDIAALDGRKFALTHDTNGFLLVSASNRILSKVYSPRSQDVTMMSKGLNSGFLVSFASGVVEGIAG